MDRNAIFVSRRRTVSPITGGIMALAYPTVLIVLALGVGFRRGGDMGEFAATLVGTVLFLVAAPTAWVLSFDFIDVTRFTVLMFGIATSLPIWYVLGVSIARSSDHWAAWMRRYATICVTWTAVNVFAIAAIAAIVG